MLAEASCCSSFRERKLVEIGIEMATRYQGEPFGLKRTLIRSEGKVGERHRIGERYHHQQGRGRHARHPDPRLIHSGRPSGADRDRVLPDARGSGLQVKIDRLLAAIGCRNCRIVAHDQLPAQGLTPKLTTVVLGEYLLEGRDSFWWDASQTLFKTANRRNLRDNRP